MPSTTVTPHARIGALLGVLLTVLAGAWLVLSHGNSHPANPTPIVQQPTPQTPVRAVRPTVNPLLPTPVHMQLEHYPRVIVGFYNPNSPVDQLTIDEAHAGAQAMHLPFVAVNLLDDAVAGPLTALLPSGQLLPNPGFAIYKRPGTLIYRSDGYLTRAAVEQAVRDAQ